MGPGCASRISQQYIDIYRPNSKIATTSPVDFHYVGLSDGLDQCDLRNWTQRLGQLCVPETTFRISRLQERPSNTAILISKRPGPFRVMVHP